VKRNVIGFAILVIAVAIMIASGVFVGHRRTEGQIVGDAKGQPAPDFELQDLNGKTVKLSDYRGKAVVVNFWATWCSPCKIEMPWFVDLQQRYGPEGLVVLGIAMDDSGHAEIQKFADEMHLNYPVLLGKEAVAESFGSVQFLPATFYIDRQGRVVDRVFGLVDRQEIENNVKKSLGSGSSANASSDNKSGNPIPTVATIVPAAGTPASGSTTHVPRGAHR
jgi:peroxiredoxin